MLSLMPTTSRLLARPATAILLAAALTPGLAHAQSAIVQDAVYSQGLIDFLDSARTGQADILLIGDSTVLTNGGHAFGLNSAFSNSTDFGLAGSGLLSGLNDLEGAGGGFFQVSRVNEFGNPAVNFTPAGVAEPRQDPNQLFNFDFRTPDVRDGFELGGLGAVPGSFNTGEPVSTFGVATVNANNVFNPAVRGVEIDGQNIAPNSSHTFTFDVAYDPTLDVATPFNANPTTSPQEITVDVVRSSVFINAAGEQEIREDFGQAITISAGDDFSTRSTTFANDLGEDYDGPVSFTLRTRNSTEAGSSDPNNFGIGLEVGNFRVRADDTTGVTITSVGFGGRSTRDLLDLQYLPLTEDFRQSTLNQLTLGGDGEALVIISETFNDLRDGDTTAEFTANITELIDQITADFVASGQDADNLSFLALGQQQTRDTGQDLDVAEFSASLHELALLDERLSFFDLRSLTEGETLDESALRLDASGLHVADFAGAEFFGTGIVNALSSATVTAVPEPTSLLLLASGGLLLARRRRRA